MRKDGPIVIIEDDKDDIEIIKKVAGDLNINRDIKWFADTKGALDFLVKTDQIIFLILCDINLPGKNGLDFKKSIDDDPELRKKTIPFIFYSTAANQEDINQAYTDMVVQGFFKKGDNYRTMKSTLKTIFDYWDKCKHPNRVS